jgi:lysine/ornithine N-monooxygenase
MEWVQYDHEVIGIEPQLPDASSTDRFRVRVSNRVTKSSDYVFAKKVIIAPGMVKRIPEPLQQLGLEDKIAHTSDLMHVEPTLLQAADECLSIAIVGGPSDEAVEVLEHCMSWDKKVKVTLFADGGNIQQTDKNPFAGNALLASNTTTLETLSRRFGHAKSEQSLDSENLSSLYTRNYAQYVRRPAQNQSRFEVVQYNKLVGAEKLPSSGQITLRLQNAVDHSINTRGPFDFVFAAAGYTRGLHEKLLVPLKEYFDEREGGLTVNADYRVNLDRRFVDRQAGIWMIDGFGNGADDAFPFMALRAERVLRSIMNVDKSTGKAAENSQKREPTQRAVL